MALGHGFKLVGRHQRPLGHLEALRWIVSAPADRAGHDGPVARAFDWISGRLAVGREGRRTRVMEVVDDDGPASCRGF